MPVHGFPSLQSRSPVQHPAMPECVQPTAGWQPSWVHGKPSSQAGASPVVQMPPWQVSSPLQRSPSAHDAPSDAGRWTQPSRTSQASIVHGSASIQSLGVPPVQLPLAHCESFVQASPLLH